MRRRRLLALAAVGLTGCLSDPPSGGNGTADGTTDAPTEASTPSGPTTTAGDPTGTGDPADAGTETPTPPDVAAYPGDCPTYDRVSRVVCSDAAPHDAPLWMSADERSVELPGEVVFTLRNDTDAEFRTNHYAARLHKRVDGEWFHVAPNGWPEPLTPLPSGERHAWTLHLSGTPETGSSGGPGSVGEEERTVGGLGGGRYAFGNDGWFPGGSYEEKTAAVATIEVEGPPADLTATDAVGDVAVDGDAVAARWSGSGGTGDEATFVVRRTDAAADRRVVTEQLLQPRPTSGAPLRDALALAVEHDAETVRLTGTTSVTPPFGVQGSTVIEYEGRTYEVSVATDESRSS